MPTPHEMTKATGIMRTSGDDKLNPALAEQVSSLRGSLYGALPAVPSCFTIAPSPDGPRIIVHDLEGGREPATVGLCDSHGFIAVLTWRELVGRDTSLVGYDRERIKDGPHVAFMHESGEETLVGLCDVGGFRDALRWLGIAIEERPGASTIEAR